MDLRTSSIIERAATDEAALAQDLRELGRLEDFLVVNGDESVVFFLDETNVAEEDKFHYLQATVDRIERRGAVDIAILDVTGYGNLPIRYREINWDSTVLVQSHDMPFRIPYVQLEDNNGGTVLARFRLSRRPVSRFNLLEEAKREDRFNRSETRRTGMLAAGRYVPTDVTRVVQRFVDTPPPAGFIGPLHKLGGRSSARKSIRRKKSLRKSRTRW